MPGCKIDPNVVINGFCYAYALVLLEELERLRMFDQVFLDGEKNALQAEHELSSVIILHPHAENVCQALARQIMPNRLYGTPSRLDEFIKLANRFMGLFCSKL